MKLKVYGCRGSLPAPSCNESSFHTEKFGGNTTCFYLEADNGRKIVIDAGSGIRPLGLNLMSKGKKEIELDLLITHTHWDHIQGFPFFVPAYIPGGKIDIYGEAQITGDLVRSLGGQTSEELSRVLQVNGHGVKEVLNDQQNSRNFPAPMDYMKGLRNFYDFIPGGVLREEEGLKIETLPINHPGGCISYKFTEPGKNTDKVTVISTDFEPDNGEKDEALIEWWRDADFVVADGQYEMGSKENPFMEGYGHSDPFLNFEFAQKAGVERILMTHHDPKSQDDYLNRLEHKLQRHSIAVAAENKHKLSLGEATQVELAREGRTYRI